MYTTSKLIIEDCTRLVFHELQYEYPALAADVKKSGLQGHNFWKEVQDFKWIKKERSPNFTLVFDGKEKAPEEEDQPVFHNPTHSVPAQIIKLEEPAKAAVNHLAPVEEHRTIINSDNFELPKHVQHTDHHFTETKTETDKPKPQAEKPRAELVKPAVNDDDDIDEL